MNWELWWSCNAIVRFLELVVNQQSHSNSRISSLMYLALFVNHREGIIATGTGRYGNNSSCVSYCATINTLPTHRQRITFYKYKLPETIATKQECDIRKFPLKTIKPFLVWYNSDITDMILDGYSVITLWSKINYCLTALATFHKIIVWGNVLF